MNLVFEIGTEELPASFQKPALEWMKSYFAAEMGKLGLAGQQKLQGFATPRRLALIATGLPEGSLEATDFVTGPPVKAGPSSPRRTGGWSRKS